MNQISLVNFINKTFLHVLFNKTDLNLVNQNNFFEIVIV